MRYLIILLFLLSCKTHPNATDALKERGFTDITYVKTERWGCMGLAKVHHSKTFKAKDSTGKHVKGNICFMNKGKLNKQKIVVRVQP